MKIIPGLLNTKNPAWAQEALSPQKVSEHLGAVSQASPVFPGEKRSFPGTGIAAARHKARWNTVLTQNSVLF